LGIFCSDCSVGNVDTLMNQMHYIIYYIFNIKIVGVCNVTIPNGGLKGCSLVNIGDACHYYCDNKYKKKNEDEIVCTTSKSWSIDVQSICVASGTISLI